MKKILKSRLFYFILGLIITIGNVYAATTYDSKNITYKNTTVKDALDDLYSKKGAPSKVRYLKLVITATKGNDDNTMQISEWQFYDKNNVMFEYPSETKISSSLVGNSSNNELIEKLIDNDINTKYCTGVWGNSRTGRAEIKLDLGETNYLDLNIYNNYAFYTANDGESRDPSTWYLYVSDDDEKYYLIDVRTDINMPSNRKTKTELFNYLIYEQYK